MTTLFSQPVRRRRLTFVWIIIPALLLAAIAAGSSMFLAHAAPAPAVSSINGHYAFRAITLTGPKANSFISADMSVQVSGTTAKGGLCGLNIAPSHCTQLTGSTTDNIHFTFAVHSIAGYPTIALTGTYQNPSSVHGGFTGFLGTFSFTAKAGTSTGAWEARAGSVAAPLTGTWHLYGLIQHDKDGDTTLVFHGDLTLVQQANGRLVGKYCPSGSTSCETTSGSNYTNLGSLYIFLVIQEPNSQRLQLRGTLTTSHRIDGQFQDGDDRGYWLAH